MPVLQLLVSFWVLMHFVLGLTMVQGDSSQSRFEATLRAKERRLRKAVIAYTGAASDFTGNSLAYMPARLFMIMPLQSPKLHSFYHR